MSKQTTKSAMTVRIGRDNYPINVSGEAIRAIQATAAATVRETLDEVEARWSASAKAAEEFDVDMLFEFKSSLEAALGAIDVLLECRPPEEWED